jgi:hypothetical protein
LDVLFPISSYDKQRHIVDCMDMILQWSLEASVL